MEEWTGYNIAMAAWGDDTQTEEQDGFASGEEYTVFAYIYGQTFSATSVEFSTVGLFSDTYSPNGFGMIISANFDGNLSSIPGCTDTSACNYNLNATDADGSCTYVDGVCETCDDGVIVDNDSDNDGVCDADEISGCTDTSACNYNSNATDEDGSCTYVDGVCDTCEDVYTSDADDD